MKLFIADIDGTLRNINSIIPGPVTRQAFEDMHREGIILGIASGRPLWQNVTDHYQEWKLSFQFDFLIGMNGGELWIKNTNERQVFHLLSEDSLKKIVTSLSHFQGINPFVYREGSELAQFNDDLMMASGKRHNCPVTVCKDISELWSEPTGKILYRCNSAEIAEKLEKYARQNFGGEIACFRTQPWLVELQDAKNNKGEGLKMYCREIGMNLKDVIAFGDAENDIEMLKIAGRAVCVKDGMPACKAAADDITEHRSDDDGVGHYLYDHHLI